MMQLIAIYAKQIIVILKNAQLVQKFFDLKKFIFVTEFANKR